MTRAVAVSVLLIAGCAHTSAGSPESTVRAYLDAVEHGRADAAFALLARSYQNTHERADLERSMSRPEAKNAKRSLGRARVVRTAELELETGDRVRLVEEDGVWRFADDPLEWYPQATPKDALTSFARAIERDRYDVLLRLMPARYRAKQTEDSLRERWQGDKRTQLLEQLRDVRAHLHETLELDGEDRASLPLGQNRAVRFVREGGAWKVESLE